MWYHIGNERRVALDHWRARLSTFADDRARLVSSWLDARRADAEVLAGSPGRARGAVGRGRPRGGRAARARGRRLWLSRHRRRQSRRPGGGVVSRPRGARRGWARQPRRRCGRADSTPTSAGAAPGPRRLVFAVPVPGDAARGGKPLGAVVLNMAPERGFYPLLTDETVPTRTGEVLLFRLDGTELTYLSPFRGTPAGVGGADALAERAGGQGAGRRWSARTPSPSSPTTGRRASSRPCAGFPAPAGAWCSRSTGRRRWRGSTSRVASPGSRRPSSSWRAGCSSRVSGTSAAARGSCATRSVRSARSST